MAYVAWSVVFGEQPTAAKWNILGSNDASFNDGTGIAALNHSVTAVTNPYQFAAYSAGQSIGTGATVKVTFGTEVFDTNNNFDSTTNYRYTAPVTGTYSFASGVSVSAASGRFYAISIYKNGGVFKRGNHISTGAAGDHTLIAAEPCMKLNSSDYVEIYFYNGDAGTNGTYAGYDRTYFNGTLVSR